MWLVWSELLEADHRLSASLKRFQLIPNRKREDISIIFTKSMILGRITEGTKGGGALGALEDYTSHRFGKPVPRPILSYFQQAL